MGATSLPAHEFGKKTCALERKRSLLTKILHTSESDSNQEDENLFSDTRRARSSSSTWSRGSVASTAGLTSDGHTSPARTGTPSPPLPPTRFPLMQPIFNQKPFDNSLPIKSPPSEMISPLQKPSVPSNEDNVEAGLGRKRRITFACSARKEEVDKEEEPPKIISAKTEPIKRPCALTFVCPTRNSAVTAKPPTRYSSPPPPSKRTLLSPKPLTRTHRGSDSTVRNDSPKALRKVPSVVRHLEMSEGDEVDRNEATRFHEFASSEEEIDDWTRESTCHKNPLTVNDTLRIENNLRKLGTEVEEEAMEEEEELDDEIAEYDEELEEDEDEDDNMSEGAVGSNEYVSDEGFHSDDEEGFAGSDDENDADSDDEWWAPGFGRHISTELVEHIRPSIRLRSSTEASIVSTDDGQPIPTPINKRSNRSKKDRPPVKTKTPELPDSTDFVCGTLDEDRPVEQAYLSALRQRQAARHKVVPQDIDPTFPTSDPDMDEEDEESEHDIISDSDHHMFMHGHMDLHEEMDLRGGTGTVVPRKRSPPHSPPPRSRMRSPPPAKRVVHRSPPPAKHITIRFPPPQTVKRDNLLFGQSPKRLHSPPPHAAKPHSPPPTRRASMSRREDFHVLPIGLASRPQQVGLSSSLPRHGHEYSRRPLHSISDTDDNGNTEEQNQNADTLPTRGAIDIVKGLEKKRQLRREKLLEKHCRLREQGKLKEKSGKCQRGKGAERMREVGLECAALKGHRRMVWKDEEGGAQHILSY